MLEITPENAIDYLREFGIRASRVETLSGGVSNQVLRVETEAGLLVLKQSRPQLRTRDAWFSDIARIFRECEVMQALRLVLGEVVPNIVLLDRDNFAYVMEHAPLDCRVWKTLLLAGDIDLALGEIVGNVLGTMHRSSAQHADVYRKFADHTVFEQLRIEPFYRRIQQRRPEVATVVAKIIDEMETRQEGICHGDYTPKNMLIHSQGLVLVDYETSHFGDPTVDLGLFLAHLILKACRAPAEGRRWVDLMDRFWAGYQAGISDDWIRRSLAHLGVCLLARTDGASPVDYLTTEEQRNSIRDLARWILLDEIGDWPSVRAGCLARFRESLD